ncbi:MAG: peptidase M3 [Halobacteriovoraceae bacterium]|nr:peptidase M3 [Halobacteriovoraceae bacterium]|tara:strand:- start:3399 stop:5435 length:2037 start_codon:yes stop_codon:yes gene_type:complete
MNPLLHKFETPFETVPFDKIKPEHFLPALQEAISQGKKDIEAIKTNTEKATFTNVCEALDSAGSLVGTVASVFFNLHSAESNDDIQNIAKEFSPLITEYSNDLQLDAELFARVKEVYDQKDSLNLNKEEMMLLEKQYKGFVRNGALLSDADKDKLRKIDQEMSSLGLTFGDNVLSETNDFLLVLDNESDLDGLPESAIEAAADLAKSKDHEGKWAVSLDYPSYIPFMTYANKRELREKVYKAFASKAFKGNDKDNQEIVKKIAMLRKERANLLGYTTHANFVLEERMAEKPEKVKEFLNNLLDKARPQAEAEMKELREFAEKNGGPKADDFSAWDQGYWSEKLKKEKFDFDSEELKPYFKLENAVQGVFDVANRLYGLKFKERKDIPVYHKDVTAYEVLDEQDRHISVFYADFFPRSGKRAGAWMTSYRDQHKVGNTDVRPHVSIVCNFTKPTSTKPSLLTFNELTTLFHEFGHALHGMLSKCTYESVSGTNVYWDFVELPSQVLENWAYEKECLDLFAKHYETGEAIPQKLIDKIKESSSFHEGRQTLRQLSFGLLDMAWHAGDPADVENVGAFEREAMSPCELLTPVDGTNMSVSFGHIFRGGYSAGYYSYKWAEVLDADAFEAFKENGIFDRATADKFRENVLEKGGSEHPMDLYIAFRGKEPTPDALLKRAGLV